MRYLQRKEWVRQGRPVAAVLRGVVRRGRGHRGWRAVQALEALLERGDVALGAVLRARALRHTSCKSQFPEKFNHAFRFW